MRKALKRHASPTASRTSSPWWRSTGPGPMDNIPTYINRKHGEEPIDCLHPMLEPILKETYGVIIYQEQVMQIAQVMAGYSLGEADLLRRAMGKKTRPRWTQQRARFVAGAVKNGVDASRGRLHLRAGRQVRRLRLQQGARRRLRARRLPHRLPEGATIREEFLAASMTLDMRNTDKLADIPPARRKRLGIASPAALRQRLGGRFRGSTARGRIRYSLAALKNIGAQAVESIVAERSADGPFKDLSDFAAPHQSAERSTSARWRRWPPPARFDALEPDRALVHGNVERHAWRSPTGRRTNAAAGPADICSAAAGHRPRSCACRRYEAWLADGAAAARVRGHRLLPLRPSARRIRRACWRRCGCSAGRISPAPCKAAPRWGRVAATVLDRSERRTKTGNKMGIFALSDRAAISRRSCSPRG